MNNNNAFPAQLQWAHFNIQEKRPQPAANFENSLVEILAESSGVQETLKRKIGRISFAAAGVFFSYATLLPSILVANAFNLFPGASVISAAAVVINFGTFGADSYLELTKILFKPVKKCCKKNYRMGQMLRILLSCLSGIMSRFPGAGITLKLAPGIPLEFRVPMAIFNVFGTCSPEIVSMYHTFDMKSLGLSQFFTKNWQNEEGNLIRKNILRCLVGLKERWLQHADLVKIIEKKNFKESESMKSLLDEVLTEENHAKALSIEKMHTSRRLIRWIIGIATSLGTCCALLQNVYFTKFAIDYFSHEEALWKWIVSIACALTIAHTSFKASYVAAYQWVDSFSGLWGNKQHKKFAEAFYPKSDAAFTVFAAFWSFALFGILYESAKSSVDITHWAGIAFFAGNFFASFFLIYLVMQNIGEKFMRAFSKCFFASSRMHQAVETLEKLQEIGEVVKNISSEDMVCWVVESKAKRNLSQTQYSILFHKINE